MKREVRGLRKLKSSERRKKRRAVGERWGWCCFHCGAFLTYETMTLDHVVPVKYGGTNANDNLRPSCSECNHERGHKSVAEFHSELQEALSW